MKKFAQKDVENRKEKVGKRKIKKKSQMKTQMRSSNACLGSREPEQLRMVELKEVICIVGS